MNSLHYMSILIILLISDLAIAQTNYISGVVRSSGNNQPIAHVEITNVQNDASTLTDHKGLFSIPVKEKSVTVLIFRHLGYETDTLNINKIPNEPLEVFLQEKVSKLTEVEVFGDANQNSTLLKTEITRIDLEKTPFQDIGSYLRTEPNMGGIRKGAMGIDPVIRGFKYTQLNVQINGGTKIEGGCPNRMDPATAHIDISDLQKITIYKGPYALKYGPNFGGLIRLVTNELSFNESYETHLNMMVGGQTNYQGYKSRLNVAGGNKLLAYSLSTNWNKYGDYSSGNGETMQGSSNNYSLKGQLGIQPVAGQKFYVGYDRSWGKNIDFPTLPMDERNDNTEIYDFSYLGTGFGDVVHFIRAHIYNSDVNHEMDNKSRPFSDTVVAISNIHAINTGGRFAINFDLGKGVLEAGSGFERISKDGTRSKTMIMQPNMPVLYEDLWNNSLVNNLGLFAEYQYKTSRFDWIASARLDINQGNSDPMTRYSMKGDTIFIDANTKSNYTNLSLSAGATWHINDHQNLAVAVGKGVRSPDITERFITLLPVGYDNYDYLGNPQLKPEANHELDLNWTYTNSRLGNLTTGVFFSFVTDYISAVMVPTSEVKPQTKGVLGVKRFINIDKAYLTGFEINYVTPARKYWDAAFSAAYTTGINPKATRYLIESGQVTGEETINNDPLPEIPPLEANVAFYVHLLKNQLSPGIKWRMVAAQNQVSKAYYEKTSPAFTTVELMVTYHYSNQVTLYGGVSNLFNTNYYEHLNRRIVGSLSPYLEPGRICYLNLIINL